MTKVTRAAAGIAGAALLAGLAASPALAGNMESRGESAYLGGAGGLNILNNIGFGSGGTLNTKDGWAALGTLGYRWGNGLRMEVEGGVRRNDATFGTTTGQLKSESLMVNGLIDIPVGIKAITPYIGGGAGMARTKTELSPLAHVDDTTFAYQGIAGLTLHISPAVEAFADYRYFSTEGLNLQLGTFPSNFGSTGEYHSHMIMGGLRWTFWQGGKPEPTPVAAAPAPVMATPKDYVIYFEFDKSNITDAAGAVLDEIKTNTQPNQSYSVVGHTDTSGPSAYNDALSERRAKSTASGLETRGVSVTSVTGRGESDPAVKTADGVKEPLNRRSVIKLNQ